MGKPDLIGSIEACEILGVDRSTLLRWASPPRLTPAVRMPGKTGAVIFNRADVLRLKAEIEAEDAAEKASA